MLHLEIYFRHFSTTIIFHLAIEILNFQSLLFKRVTLCLGDRFLLKDVLLEIRSRVAEELLYDTLRFTNL